MTTSKSASQPDGMPGDYDSKAIYRGYVFRSYYVPVRDGTRLAVDVILPKGMAASDRIPAVLVQTRYWRLLDVRAPFKYVLSPEKLSPRFSKQVPFFASRGYALVLADVRGTGASFGVWRQPWAEECMDDAYDLVEWIVGQPWSNGRVGGMGVSYVGQTAELLGACGHPAVKCAMPMFSHPDAYLDIAFPGGVFNERFIRDWGELDWTFDENQLPPEMGPLVPLVVKGVKPVDGFEELLPQAIKEHEGNGRVFEMVRGVASRDERRQDQPTTFDDVVVHRYQDELERADVAFFGWASWMDAGTADAAIRRFSARDNATRAIVGAWEHGANTNSSPYRKSGARVSPSIEGQMREMMRFLDHYLKGIDTGVQNEKRLYYYTLGAEEWHSTDVWPPRGASMQRWFMQAGHRLSPQRPAEEQGVDSYVVDFEATTGDLNRWWEIGGFLQKPVTYKRRAQAGERLLTYFTPPFQRDTEITGHPLVSLSVTSTCDDGAFIVYLEDVDERGEVTYITEGELRAIHRQPGGEPPPFASRVPYHSFRQADARPLLPGETAELVFALNPVSVLIRRGHRIRVGIAGHDKGTFARVPDSGLPLITVARNRHHSSWVELPVVEV